MFYLFIYKNISNIRICVFVWFLLLFGFWPDVNVNEKQDRPCLYLALLKLALRFTKTLLQLQRPWQRHPLTPPRHLPLRSRPGRSLYSVLLHIGQDATQGRHAPIISPSHSTHTARWLHGTYRQRCARVTFYISVFNSSEIIRDVVHLHLFV